jgi:hypothetical protein
MEFHVNKVMTIASMKIEGNRQKKGSGKIMRRKAMPEGG